MSESTIAPAAAATTEPTGTPYYWIITIQSGQGRIQTKAGVISILGGQSRAEIFQMLCDDLTSHHGQFIVLFFDLSPDRLEVDR